MNFISLFISILVGVFITYACIYLLAPIARRIGLVDLPGGRKTHANTVPLIGGIAIFMGFCFALLCLNISLQHYRGLLAGSGILILIGILDDFHELTPRIRLIGQCLAALMLIEWGHSSLLHLGHLFFLGDVNLGFFSIPITIFFVLAFVNAINLIDGNDGLASSVIFGEALLLAYLSWQFEKYNLFYFLVILMSALSVFILFNFPFSSKKSARIFMGDAGSTFLGFVIVWFAVDLSQLVLMHPKPDNTFNPITILWILAYPLYDLSAVIIHRLLKRASPFSASRDHLHFLLLDNGFKPRAVTLILFSFSMIVGVVGIFFAQRDITESWQLLIFLVLFAVYFCATRRLIIHTDNNNL